MVPGKAMEEFHKFLGNLKGQKSLMVNDVADGSNIFHVHPPPEISPAETNAMDDEGCHKRPDRWVLLDVPRIRTDNDAVMAIRVFSNESKKRSNNPFEIKWSLRWAMEKEILHHGLILPRSLERRARG